MVEIPIITDKVHYDDLTIEIAVRKLNADIMQVKTDYTGFLTIAHPLIDTLQKWLDSKGFYVKGEKFSAKSWLWFGITEPCKPRIFYFRVMAYARKYY